MKSDKKILVAFLLNFVFSVFELIGGAFTGSVAIISDAIHDFGDSISIGVSYFLEKTSKKKPDMSHTYGYIRYSVLGSVITTVILLFGSVLVIYNAINRIINPVPINYNGVILLAVIGALINFVAAYFTSGGHSLNQKAVNLHMLEDVFSWIVVLAGSVIMKITNISVIDPIMSIAVAIFIFIAAFKNLKFALDIFLEKTPKSIDVSEIKEHILKIEGVLGVHHIHIRTIDGYLNYATLHIVTDEDSFKIKNKVKDEMREHKIAHITVEIEKSDEVCEDIECKTEHSDGGHSHHHHH